MKKIIALVVAVLMMAAIAVPAFAAWDTEFNTVGAGNTTEVIFGVTEGYTIKIPQTVNFEGLAASATIVASSVKIPGNKALQVTVSSTQYDKGEDEAVSTDDTWVLEDRGDASDDVPYMITVGGNNVVSGSTIVLEVLSSDTLTDLDDVTSGTTKSATLSFTTEGTSQVGDYRDVLTFAAALGTPTAP